MQLIAFAVIVAAGCRREAARLEPVQRMAYEVKPAVVRVNAYGEARFVYTTRALRAVAERLVEQRYPAEARARRELSVETGAGGSGSGFVVHPGGWIVTSAHVVDATRDRQELERQLKRNGAIAALIEHFSASTIRMLHRDDRLDEYVAFLQRDGSLEDVRITNQVELSNGERLPFVLRRASAVFTANGPDVALLLIDRRDLPSLRLGDSDRVRLQESVWVIGYPAVASTSDEVIGGWLSQESDLEATVSRGEITSIRRDQAQRPVLQTNAPIYRGNSGGPAVDRDGEVVGIATWGHTTAEQIRFLVPINLAKQILAEERVAINVTGEFQEYYSRALGAAEGGRWGAALEDLRRAGKLYPGSPDVIRLTRDAEMNRGSDYEVDPLALGSALAALFVITATAATVMLRRRRLVQPAAGWSRPMERPMERPVRRAGELLGRLTILNGEIAGARFGIGVSGVTIGRESAVCDIVLENPRVSRLHAELVSIDGGVLLIDRNSSNGTFVNDKRIERSFLRDGDIIHFGGRNAVAAAFNV